MKASAQNGLGLLEVLVCIAILGILATLAVPSYINLLEQRQIIAVAEAIASDFRWARSEALKSNSDITLTFEPGSAGNWLYTITTPNATLLKSVESAKIPEFSQVSLDENLRDHSTSFNSTRGTTEGKNGTITLTSANGYYTLEVILSNLGRSRICSKNESLGDYAKCL